MKRQSRLPDVRRIWPKDIDIGEFHWLMDMLQTIDVGLVVLDREYRVKAWNSFYGNHSGLKPARGA